MTFQLIVEVYKPKERLREGEPYLSQPQIPVKMIRYLREIGLRFKLVLADSLYGKSHSSFINVLNELPLNYAVAIRSNTTFPQIYYNKTQARKDDCMKVKSPERIEDTMSELKIIMSQQRTVTRPTKSSGTLFVKIRFEPEHYR